MRLQLMMDDESSESRMTPADREDRVLDLLQNIRDVEAPWADRVAAARSYLNDTHSSMVRGYAALALADLDWPGTAGEILEILRRPGAAKDCGTLLFALSELEASLPLEIAAAITGEGSYEAQSEIDAAIEEDRILPFDRIVADRVVAAITPLLESGDGPTEELAGRLLHYVASKRGDAIDR